MSTAARPSKVYSPPSYVKVLGFAGLILLFAGLLVIVLAIGRDDSVAPGVTLLMLGGLNIFYSEIANAIAITNWRTELLAWELQPAIDELRLQADEREKRVRQAEIDQEAEILRAVRARQGQTGE